MVDLSKNKKRPNMYRSVLLCSAAVAVVAAAPPGGYYATKYDHIDIDNILNTRRLVNYYAACLTEKGPCTPQGLEFKKILPEALRTNCLRCTEKQRVATYRAIKRLKKEYPKIWKQLSDLWDPKGEYVRKFEESFDISTNTISATESISIVNRFDIGDEDEKETSTINNKNINKPYPSKIPTGDHVQTSSTTTRVNIQKISKPTTESTSTLASTETTSTTTTSASPITITRYAIKTIIPPTPSKRPYGVVNNKPGLQTTVSVTTNNGLNDLARTLGSVGSKVIQAGTRFAGMLISTVQTVVGH